MKKYLMTAMAAVAMGVAFTSCSHNSDLYGGEEGGGKINGRTAQEQIELDKAVYKAAFERTFGKVAPTVDWGFGSGSANTRAFTRVNTGENYPSTSTGINANANEWADPEKEFGGWLVPDPLTEGQKERVRKYFQANPNPGNKDPQWRHFFVQQVYKGGTAQAGNSSENITAANNSVYNSDNMNLLTVGQNHQHINNFNAGTCSTNNEVLDNGGNVNDGPYHSDQIMLMVNIDDTSCFGYHETGSSTHHDNKWALVSAAVIDEWAAKNGNPGEAVDDKWNRSFMGFDLAIKEGAQAYATDNNGNVIYATYDQAPGQPRYVWDGQNVICMYEEIQKEDQWGNKWIEYGALKDEYKTIMNVGWLTTNENFYIAADKVTLGQTSSNLNAGKINEQDWNSIKDYVVFDDAYVEGAQNNKAKVLNLKRIKELIDVGYLPVNNKSLTEWVKVGKSDGYFTDWIVTLTEAKRIDEQNQETPTYRVIAEDLTASEASDFDFNDVVFDVEPIDAGHAKIVLRAAGGIYKLTVAGQEVHAAFGETADAEGLYPMINTQPWNPDVKATLIESYSGDFSSDSAIRNTIKGIEIKVYKPGYEEVGAPLDAKTGEPACKILVDQTYIVATERADLGKEYKKFKAFVTGELEGHIWW